MERNPYSPPQAVVVGVDGGRRRERPVPAAVIVLLYVGNALVMGLRVIDYFQEPIVLTGAELRFYRLTGPPHATAIFLSCIFSLMVAVQLYRMKRSAAYFISACLAVSVFSWCCFFLGLDASELAELAFSLVGCAMELLMVGYVWHLFRKGVLK